jgi:hypothetical protein
MSERNADAKDIAAAMVRLSAAFGEPFQKDQADVEAMHAEWVKAFGERPVAALTAAVDRWIASCERWPRIAQLIELADTFHANHIRATAAVAGVHEARIKLPSSMFGFVLKRSGLRTNPKWADWLNSQHPSLEHFYFAEARAGQYEHQITVQSDYCAHYIISRHGDALERVFGRKLSVAVEGKKNVNA